MDNDTKCFVAIAATIACVFIALFTFSETSDGMHTDRRIKELTACHTGNHTIDECTRIFNWR